MWLKIDESMLSDGQNPIFSSGALTEEPVTYRGVTLLIICDDIKVNFKRTNDRKKWKAESNINGKANKWMHLTGTWAVSGTAQLYIDGALNSTSIENEHSPSGPNLPDTMTVGVKNTLQGKFGQFILDEWYFWDWELSGDQVVQVYAAYQTGDGTFKYILREPYS